MPDSPGMPCHMHLPARTGCTCRSFQQQTLLLQCTWQASLLLLAVVWVLLLRQQLTTRACTCAAQPQRRHVAAARLRSRRVGWAAGLVHPSVAVAAFWAAAAARHHTHAGRARQHTDHTGRTEAMEHAQASTADAPHCAGAAAGQRVVPATSLDGLIYRLTSLCMSLGFCCSVLQDMHTSQWPAAQQQHNSNTHTSKKHAGVLYLAQPFW